MDEIPTGRRNTLEAELATLAAKLRKARLIITTRSGDYTRNIEGLDAIELLPLSDGQIAEIASSILGDATHFLDGIRNIPNRESLRRPIALTQILVLFRSRGALPDQPSVTTKKLIALYLEEWDFHNRLHRESRYANFPPERKFDFLSAMSFHLMYRSGSQSFTFHRSTLERIYGDIHQSFGLPAAEASRVAQEIETHTGIIIQTGLDDHEFTDLPTQEFLAASYIVRDPFSLNIFEYLGRYPGPVALSVVLAADPVAWLAHIFLHSDTQRRLLELSNTVSEFLRRLMLERPYFYESGMLGYTIVTLADKFAERSSAMEALDELLSLPSVRPSLATALAAYSVSTATPEDQTLTLALRRAPSLGGALVASEAPRIPPAWLTPEQLCALHG